MSGAAVTAQVALIAGALAALISLLQSTLGAVLAGTASPDTAHLLYDAVNRLDGAKMLVLAIFGLARAASGVLPEWLRYAGITLAIAITASGVAYLLTGLRHPARRPGHRGDRKHPGGTGSLGAAGRTRALHATTRAVWTAIALVTLALSLTGPLSSRVTRATKVALAGMHLAAAAVLVPMLTARVSHDPHLV